jgi:hypothetical protein
MNTHEEIQYIDTLREITKGINSPTINIQRRQPNDNSYDKQNYRRKYYQLNKEYYAQYREKNKERNRLYQLKYNAKRRARRALDLEIKRLTEHA